MSSAVDLCNLALSHLGDEATVSSIDPPEGSAQAEHCARWYPIARRTLIERHTWSFSTRRAALALAPEDPPTSWAYAYVLPAQCIKPFSVLYPESTSDDDTQDFAVETMTTGTKVLYTNVETATLVYAVDVTDTTKFSPLVELAISRLLASLLAGPIIKGTEGMNVAKAHRQAYEQVELPQAMASDARTRQTSSYDNFTPSGIAARA